MRLHFRCEFLNRLDDTVLFKPLTQTASKRIVDLMLARAAGNRSRGTDRMKDVAGRADEEHMSRGRVTVRSLYPAG